MMPFPILKKCRKVGLIISNQAAVWNTDTFVLWPNRPCTEQGSYMWDLLRKYPSLGAFFQRISEDFRDLCIF
jgi:hypothetical protein